MKNLKQNSPAPALLLALETSTKVSSVALFENDELLGLAEYHQEKLHSRAIMPMVDSLFRDLGKDKSELSAVVVSSGPGSYTGLRVGVSVAKGICMGLELPLISINTLEGLAWGMQALAIALDAFICPMLDARRMELYYSLFDSAMKPLSENQILILDSTAFSDIPEGKKVIFCGDAAAKSQEVLSGLANAVVLEGELFSAAHLGQVSFRKFKEQQFENLLSFEPFYMKEFSASPERKKL